MTRLDQILGDLFDISLSVCGDFVNYDRSTDDVVHIRLSNSEGKLANLLNILVNYGQNRLSTIQILLYYGVKRYKEYFQNSIGV